MTDVKVDDYMVGQIIKAIVREGQKVIIKTEEGTILTLVPSFDVLVQWPATEETERMRLI